MPLLDFPAPTRSTRSARTRGLVPLLIAVLALAPAAHDASAAPLALLQAAGASRIDTTSSNVTAQTQRATRAQLTAALERAERTASSGSGAARTTAQNEAAAIRVRLRNGDFQVGDRIALATGGDTARREVTVREGVQIDLPYGIPSLSLAGVLRAELTGVVDTHLRKYVRDPDVRARALQRVQITGAVGRPGVYWVSSDVPVAELVQLAGGTGAGTQTDRITVARAGRQVIDRKAYSRLVREGRTLEEAGVQPGDEVRVPTQRQGRSVGQILTYSFFAVSAVTAIIAFIRSSYN
jgi:NADH:ubiquinone oxidoreductase subunit F (NADH-binding)